MTKTYNLSINLASWIGGTTYNVGTRVYNSGNLYQCIANGNASGVGGPTGTGNNISDGTTSWTYKANIDYYGGYADGVFTSAQNGLPATFTQPIIWQFWKGNGPATMIQQQFVSYLNLSGHTIAPYYLLMTPAPGEGFRDSLFLNKSVPYTTNTNLGFTFLFPSNGQIDSNYFEIGDSNVIIDGFQFIDLGSYSQCTIIDLMGNNSIIQYCLFDGYGQNNGAWMVGLNNAGANNTIKHCLMIDRSAPNTYTGIAGVTLNPESSTNYIYNSGFVSYNNAGASSIALLTNHTVWANGCYFFGYGSIPTGGTGTTYWANCASDCSAVPQNGVDSGGNHFSTTASSCFINYPNNFDLKETSLLRNNTAVVTTETPALDIARTERPSSGHWDIGPLQFQYNTFSPLLKIFR